MKNIQVLREIAEVFLSDQVDYLNLSNTIIRYKKLLLEVSEINLDSDESKTDTHFENGKAIGSAWAASCMDDLIRTQKFIKGVFETVNYLKSDKVDPIHILYAGTGPFAALILPLLATFAEHEIQVTLIEINKNSYESVKKVFSRLNFNGFIKAIVNEDAIIPCIIV